MRPYARQTSIDREDQASTIQLHDAPTEVIHTDSRPNAWRARASAAVDAVVALPEAVVSCAVKTIVKWALIVLVFVAVIGTLGYFALRGTALGTTIAETTSATILGAISSDDTLQSILYRRRFSTIDSPVLLPLSTPYGIRWHELGNTVDLWAGWVDMRSTLVRYNTSSSSSASSASNVAFLSWWKASETTSPTLVRLGSGRSGVVFCGTTSDPIGNLCRTLAEVWMQSPDAMLVALLLPSSSSSSSPTWDQARGEIVALARLL